MASEGQTSIEHITIDDSGEKPKAGKGNEPQATITMGQKDQKIEYREINCRIQEPYDDKEYDFVYPGPRSLR